MDNNKIFHTTLLISKKSFLLLLAKMKDVFMSFCTYMFHPLGWLMSLIFFIFTFVYGLLYMMGFNLWWIIYHNMASLLLLSLLMGFLSKDPVIDFSSFICFYLMSESMCEGFFLLGYLLDMSEFYSFVLLSKLGVFPFMHSYFLTSSMSFKMLLPSLLFMLFNFLSKIWVVVFISSTPISEVLVWDFVVMTSIFLLLSLKSDLKDFVMKSFMFSDVFVLMVAILFPVNLIIFYLLLVSFFQLKVLSIFKTTSSMTTKGYLYLTLLNGSPLFGFNWMKFLVMLSSIKLGGLKLVVITLVSFIFLFFSMYLCQSSKEGFYSFKGEHHQVQVALLVVLLSLMCMILTVSLGLPNGVLNKYPPVYLCF